MKPLTTLALLFVATVLLLVIFSGTPFTLQEKCVYPVNVHGDIARGNDAFGDYASSYEITRQIKAAEESDEAGAILLDVDSPGGAPVASKEIYDAVANASKPVVAYFGESAASGGYYAAAPADYIIANPNTMTGSIGARATLMNYRGLFDKLGLTEETIESGDLKDMGSGYRNLTDEERAILQDFVNEEFANFKSDVEKARQGKLTAAYPHILDARILTASQALDAGLVDEVAGRGRALEKAAELGNASAKECDVPQEFSLLRLFASMGSAFAQGFKNELSSQTAVKYG